MPVFDKSNFLKILKIRIFSVRAAPSPPAASCLPPAGGTISLLAHFEPFLQPSTSRGTAAVRGARSRSGAPSAGKLKMSRARKLSSYLRLWSLSTSHRKGKAGGGNRVGFSPASARFKRAPEAQTIQNSPYLIFK